MKPVGLITESIDRWGVELSHDRHIEPKDGNIFDPRCCYEPIFPFKKLCPKVTQVTTLIVMLWCNTLTLMNALYLRGFIYV